MMSADRHLKIDVSDEESDNTDMVKQKMKNIIDIAAAGNTLQNLRQKSDNLQLFETFVSYCLIHFTISCNWQYNASSIVISKISTPSNEALYILLLDNNTADYAIMHHEQRKIHRKEAEPKWTKVENRDKNKRLG